MQTIQFSNLKKLLVGVLFLTVALGVGSRTIWIGAESPLVLAAALAGVGLFVTARLRRAQWSH